MSTRLDYQTLAVEIIKHLRKEMSQRELSERLRYTFNQVGKWESGATQIKFCDFLDIANALNIPIEKHFRDSFWYIGDEFTTANFIKAMRFSLDLNTLQSKAFKKSHEKWLQGMAEPDFAEVLTMMGTAQGALISWLSRFVDCEEIPCLREIFRSYLRRIDTLIENPHVAFIAAALQLDAYKNLPRHDDAFLLEHAACTLDELRGGLRALVHSGLVGIQNKKYVPMSFDFSFPGVRNPKLRLLAKRALSLTAARYPLPETVLTDEGPNNTTMGSIRVTELSTEAAEQVAILIADLHNSISEIIRKDHGRKNNVQVIVMQSFPSNINR